MAENDHSGEMDMGDNEDLEENSSVIVNNEASSSSEEEEQGTRRSNRTRKTVQQFSADPSKDKAYKKTGSKSVEVTRRDQLSEDPSQGNRERGPSQIPLPRRTNSLTTAHANSNRDIELMELKRQQKATNAQLAEVTNLLSKLLEGYMAPTRPMEEKSQADLSQPQTDPLDQNLSKGDRVGTNMSKTQTNQPHHKPSTEDRDWSDMSKSQTNQPHRGSTKGDMDKNNMSQLQSSSLFPSSSKPNGYRDDTGRAQTYLTHHKTYVEVPENHKTGVIATGTKQIENNSWDLGEYQRELLIYQQLNTVQPPKFKGDTNDSISWLMTYNEVSCSNNWSELTKIKQVRQNLEYAAKSWYRSVWKGGTPQTWKEFEEQFKNAFISGSVEDHLRLKLSKLRQRPQQTLLEYYYSAMELCVMVDDKMSEFMKIHYIIDGMSIEPRSLIRMMNPKTIRDLQRMVNSWNRENHPNPREPQLFKKQYTEEHKSVEQRPERTKNEPWCLNCGQQGHYTRGCPKTYDPAAIEKRKTDWSNKAAQNKREHLALQQKLRTVQHINERENQEEDVSDEDVSYVPILMDNGSLTPPLEETKLSSVKVKQVNDRERLTKITCKVNGLRSEATIDTGATISVIPLEVALVTKTTLYEWPYQDLEMANGASQKPFAWCRIFIEYRDRTHSVSAVVLEDSPDVLLGEDYLRKSSMVISYQDKIATYHDHYMDMITGRSYNSNKVDQTEPDRQTAREVKSLSGPPYHVDYVEHYDVTPNDSSHEVKHLNLQVQKPQGGTFKSKRRVIIPPLSRGRLEVKVHTKSQDQPFIMEPDSFPCVYIIPGIGKRSTEVIDVINLGREPLILDRRQKLGKVISLTEDSLELNEVSLGDSLTGDQRQLARTLLKDHEELYVTKNENIGIVPFLTHQVDTGDSEPIRSKPYRVSIKEQQVIQNLVNEMLEADIIRPSRSQWASPIVLVKKKDTNELRFCVDYRKLNKVTKIDPYPIPNMDTVLETLSGNHYFSKLDVKAMYWQVRMDEADRQKTAFVVHCGQYEFNVMPFGLVSAPMTAMRVMNQVTNGLENTCFVFYDDILVFTPTFEEHINALKKLFTRLDQANIKLNKSKCDLFLQSVHYLGHIVTPEGIRPDPGKLEAISQFKIPSTITDARSFMGMCNFYRRYIKGFANIARPIHDTIRVNHTFKWTREAQLAMEELKMKLTTPPLLVHYDSKGILTIRCDASGYGLGAVLIQKSDDPTKTGIVAFTSRTLSSSEKNYATTHKECLAVVHAVKHWRHYLYGIEFNVITDHHALCWLMKSKDHTGQLMRWSLLLQEYRFKVLYESGKTHADADCLSRYPLDQSSQETETELPTWPIHDLQKSKSTVYAVNLKMNDLIKPIYDVKDEQSKDKDLKSIMKTLIDPDIPKRAKRHLRKYAIRDDQLYKLSRTGKKYLLVIPKSMTNYVLEETHDKPTGGHFGVKRTLESVKSRFYWKTLDQDVRAYIKTCDKCQKKKTDYNDKQGLMIPMTIPQQPFERIGMDLTGPLPISKNQNTYILVITDYLTKYVIAKPLKKATTAKIVEILKSTVFYTHGMPRIVVTDNGANLTSTEMRKLFKLLGVTHKTTSPYRPQTNGQTERYNRVIGTQLTIFAGDKPRDWDQYLDALVFAYNTTIHASHLNTPYYLVHGRSPCKPIDRLLGRPIELESLDSEDQVSEDLILQEARKFAKLLIETSQVKSKLRYDKNRHNHTYKVNDLVLRLKPTSKLGDGKLNSPWAGPYKVLKKLTEVNYQITTIEDLGMDFIVHVTQIKPYISRRDNQLEEGEDDSRNTPVISNLKQPLTESVSEA